MIEGIDTASESFIFEVSDRIAEKLEITDDHDSLVRIRALPENLRFIEPIIYYFTEVMNGGHHQYFWNSQGVFREIVLEGLRYYAVVEFEKVFADALDIYRPEHYEAERGATWDAFQAAYKLRRFRTQDEQFVDLKPTLADQIAVRCRSAIAE